MTIHGFDLDSPLVCEGVIGDGCGGGRLFIVEEETLKAYDPERKESFTLLKDVKNAISLSKSGCLISIKSKKELIEFDLSSMTKSTTEI